MFKIAWRNVLRNKRRSCLIVVIMAIGVAVLYLTNGYINGSYEGLQQMAVAQYGNLQIAQAHFWDNDNQRHLVSRVELEKVKQLLAQRGREVQSYSTSLKVNGILGTEKLSTIVMGEGIEPGSAQSKNLSVCSGSNLYRGDCDRVLLGRGVMQKLGVREGEAVSLMATTLDGAYNAGSLKVAGAVTVGSSEADNVYMYFPISYAQSLLNTDGVDKVTVYLHDLHATGATVQWLRTALRREGLMLEVRTWWQLAEYYHQVRILYEMLFCFMSVLIFLLTLAGIMEIMSMAFFERMNEIGTARAIGAKRRQILMMLLQEGLILGVLGGVCGWLVGWGAGFGVNSLHISYSPPGFSHEVPMWIKLALNNGTVPFGIIVTAALLSAFYPALKASRLNIVTVLRHR